MRPLARRLTITVLSFTVPLLIPLSQQKRYKRPYNTQTRGDDLSFTSMPDPLLSFILCMVGSRRLFFSDNSNMLCLLPTGIVQLSYIFLSLSSKTNAYTRQDFYDTKQYYFCPHAAKINTKWKFLRGGLKVQFLRSYSPLQNPVIYS